MDFLTANTKSLLDQYKNGGFIEAGGKDVAVIGGGDTGTDCVGTSLRHGCKSLVQVEILPRPPLERARDNPWPEWPKTYKLDYGQEEAAAKFGADPRVYLTTATKFEGDAHGRVKAVHTVEVQWARNDKGQFIPKHVPGTKKVLPAQLVLLAMGFLGPEQPLLEALGIERDARSNAKAEFEKYTTNIPKVFAAGDCRRGAGMRSLPDGRDGFAVIAYFENISLTAVGGVSIVGLGLRHEPFPKLIYGRKLVYSCVRVFIWSRASQRQERTWLAAKSSGLTTKRASASSPRIPARTSSCTTRPSSVRALKPLMKATLCPSKSFPGKKG